MHPTPPLQHPDGSWKYTNRLMNSSSPYLLQHAHNPVDWHPWGEEALTLAQTLDKPILVSIGYSTCYWCHVMERQVFCNPEVAELMNKYFVNIKVDREERPDLDAIYMAARQLMTREGGWPNHVILTPEMKPFFAGGTFAADDRYGKPSFPEVLFSIADIWKTKREIVQKSADEATRYIHAQLSSEKKDYATHIMAEHILPEKLYTQLLEYADKANGGFFHEPKFPHETYLLFLLAYYHHTNAKEALDIVTSSLDKMAAGGIYDQIGGGFHRYAVDEEWKVPHFEKMLYNQALLACCYSEAYSVTRDPSYRYITESTLGFATSHLMSEEGGFYSALDAETDAVEGAYYVWKEAKIRTLLKEKSDLFFSCFALAEVPRFAGHKHPDGGVLYVHDLNARQEHHQKLLPLIALLATERKKRPLPFLDTKIITAWHSMMVGSLAKAGMALEKQEYIAAAEKGAGFTVRSLLQEDGRLLRIARAENQQVLYGFLEDYAFTLWSFLLLYEATNNPAWLEKSLSLAKKTFLLFEDKEEGGFFFSEAEEPTLIHIKEADDNALPSANAVMLHVLTQLLEHTSDPSWRTEAGRLIAAFKGEMHRSPISYTHMIAGLERLMLLPGEWNSCDGGVCLPPGSGAR